MSDRLHELKLRCKRKKVQAEITYLKLRRWMHTQYLRYLLWRRDRLQQQETVLESRLFMGDDDE